jgi:glutathionylspermidine synthase
MKRHVITPRKDWEKSVEADGLIWHTADGVPYWDESAYYSFTMDQVEAIEDATVKCHELFMEAGQYILDNELLNQFGIPEASHAAIQYAWDNELPALNYGRFDFGYDGINPPKLFEYNCDTPTSLLEAAIIQWNWKEEVFPKLDQFNSIHESLVSRWVALAPEINTVIHFAHVEDEAGEDILNVSYMRDVVQEAGLESIGILMNEIGFDSRSGEFIDLDDEVMKSIYKLYPWEWLMSEEIGEHIIENLDSTQWIEPIWKMMWSNKAILPILWHIAPDHPNLLATTYRTYNAR